MRSEERVLASPRVKSVAVVGNPNTGKTTLFNALTGFRQRVGNYPGVTVESKVGWLRDAGETGAIEVIDLPGTYSLSARSADEAVVLDTLLGHTDALERPDLIVVVVDASHPRRNLFLLTQILELGRPVIVALNMMDVARGRGIHWDAAALARRLGVPVVPVVATRREGIEALTKTILTAEHAAPRVPGPALPPAVDAELAALEEWKAGDAEPPDTRPVRAQWLQALLDPAGYHEQRLAVRWGADVTQRLGAARARLEAAGHGVPEIEAVARYAWIEQLLRDVVTCPHRPRRSKSEGADRVLTHPVAGLLIFAGLMLLMFQSLYEWAAPLADAIDRAVALSGAAVANWVPPGTLRSLLVDGALAGVGAVLVFLPQIMLLFLFLGILEDCGYLSRAALLVDRFMNVAGLSGKSVIPLLTSFGCAVPGILATRTIENARDRVLTMLIAPLMSCSARLPVYVLLVGAFVPERTLLGGWLHVQATVLTVMYLIGVIVAIPVAWVLKRTLLRGETLPFLMELPAYRWPTPRTVLYRVYEQGKEFCLRAGTIVFAVTVVIWALGYYPRPASVTPLPAAGQDGAVASGEAELAAAARAPAAGPTADGTNLEGSYLGRMGRWLEPVVRPLGWDWRIATATIASLPARELVVATLGTLFHMGGGDGGEPVELKERLQRAVRADGRPVFTLPVALSVMVFFSLCCQCAATLAAIQRETHSWRWPALTFGYMTALAYVGALVTYQVASRLMA
ncbi:MAG TPA: ferrous iron transport protein B [Phycisphaerae bacterium]|nr:ferrous iron transport protein B [Phycisphaerae bacterium]HNU44625.1 ferrous iron transport protein B [Phycisphaerae bacterium]